MENQKLQELIQTLNPKAECKMGNNFVEVEIESSELHSLAKSLKDNKETAFDFIFNVTAVDYLTHFTMVYHLDSSQFHHVVVLKSKITDREKPTIDSVCDIWIGADFHEREIFDLFGIHFNNHPDLRRIFLDNDWVGYPMRKDYVDEVNIVER
jgi:NADH-quinone oxidoreductase subunit C